MLNALAHVEQVGTTNQLVEAAHAELRHDLPHFFGNKEEEIDHIFRLARKLLTQLRVLRGNAHRTGIEVTFAHHNAA